MSKQFGLQRQFQALAAQNETLRAKAKKINQIQAYVNILMQSSQSCQQELNRANLQNRELKNQIDRMMGENVRLQKTFQTEFKTLQTQLKRNMAKKDQQIRILLAHRQKDKNIFQQTLKESQNRSKNDLEKLKLQFHHIESEYEAEIKKLTNNLTVKSRNLEESEISKNQMKKAYLEQANKINIEINQLERGFQYSQNQNFLLKDEIQRLSKTLQQIRNAQNLLRRELSRKQDEILNDKKSFQKRIRAMEQNLNESLARQKKLQQKLNEVSLENEKLRKQLGLLSGEANDLSIQLKKMQRLLSQKQQQIKQLIIKNQQQQQQNKRTVKRHSEQLKRVEEELNLTNERFLCQKNNSDSMRSQIQDLLKVVDKLEQNMTQNQHNLQMLNKQNSVLFKQVQNIGKQLQYKTEQLHDIDIRYRDANQNAIMLEQMYQKQKIKSQSLQKQNNQIIARLQSITKEQKSLQQEQISHLIEKHLGQKRQLLQANRIEKQTLVKKYEIALKDRDQQAKKRLQLLEDEISLMRIRR